MIRPMSTNRKVFLSGSGVHLRAQPLDFMAFALDASAIILIPEATLLKKTEERKKP